VSDDAFVDLIVESLNLMHPRFAGATGRSLRFEFYHQFRHLWDKALPVQLGLGHVLIQDDPAIPHGLQPDFLFWQVGEKGQPDRRLGAVSFVSGSDLASLEPLRPDLGVPWFGSVTEVAALARLRSDSGYPPCPCYPHAVCVIVGRVAEVPTAGLPSAPGLTVVFFDTDRWQAVVVPNQEGG
jgi:hypothetical protein